MRALTILGVLIHMWVANPVFANILASPRSSPPQIVKVDAVISQSPKHGFQLLQKLTLTNPTHEQIVWISVVPSLPEVNIGPSVFAEIAKASDSPKSYSQQLRQQPFGPSILTAIPRWFSAQSAPANQAQSPLRQLQIHDLQLFPPSGSQAQHTNSTPSNSLQAYLRQYNIELPPTTFHRLTSTLQNGWVVLVAVLYDPEPGPAPAQVGPLHLRFSQGQPVIPMLLSAAQPLTLTVSTLGPTPLAPAELETYVATTDKPQATEQESGGRSEVKFLGTLAPFPALQADLLAAFGSDISPSTILTHMIVRVRGLKLHALHLRAPHENRYVSNSWAEIPQPPGNSTDLLLCILLGLFPLGFTPEIWLLWFASKQVHGTYRGAGWKEGRRARWLGSLWCLIVAAYWFYTLHDLARIALLGPLVVGTALIAIPYSGREPTPIRVPFRKRATGRKNQPTDRNSARV